MQKPRTSKGGAAYQVYGRYALFDEIASGGMASVHLGRQLGVAGFVRTVAIKRLKPELVSQSQFVAMFLDEARIAARIRHPNVVTTLDVFAEEQELFLVLEYVHGDSLRALLREQKSRGGTVDPKIAVNLVCAALHGLHAAHQATDEQGAPLGIVHRDVSPENVMVDDSGMARVADFGIARATGRIESTVAGQMKGKLRYMSPEQVKSSLGQPDRRTDVFAAGIVLWETLTGRRLFTGTTTVAIAEQVLLGAIARPSQVTEGVPASLDEVVLKALARDPERRFDDARSFALALEAAMPKGVASQHAVADWVGSLLAGKLADRVRLLRSMESALPSDAEQARAAWEGALFVSDEKSTMRMQVDEPPPETRPADTEPMETTRLASQARDGDDAGSSDPSWKGALFASEGVSDAVTVRRELSADDLGPEAPEPSPPGNENESTVTSAALAERSAPPPRAGAGATRWLAWVAAAVLVGGGGAWVASRASRSPAPVEAQPNDRRAATEPVAPSLPPAAPRASIVPTATTATSAAPAASAVPSAAASAAPSVTASASAVARPAQPRTRGSAVTTAKPAVEVVKDYGL